MAKTVFGTEIHFRLLGGRLAYVPWDEMLAQLKADAPKHVDKLRDSPRVELSLPVVAGFGVRYILRKNDVQMQTRIGTATQSRVELEKLYFIDAEPNLGVPARRGASARQRIQKPHRRAQAAEHDGHSLGLSRQLRSVPRRSRPSSSSAAI